MFIKFQKNYYYCLSLVYLYILYPPELRPDKSHRLVWPDSVEMLLTCPSVRIQERKLDRT